MSGTFDRRGLRRGLLAGVFVVLSLLIFTAWQAWQVHGALDDVAEEMTAVVDKLAKGKIDSAGTSADRAADSAGEALKHTRGPVWWTASKLPWVGDDVTAVRTVSEVAADLTGDTIPDLVEAASTFGPDSLAPRRGRIDLEPIPAAAALLSRGAGEIESGRSEVAELETAGLLEELRAPVLDLQEKLTKASDAAGSAALAAELMPDMLGAGGPRYYLAVFQNNAEIRSQGGIFGAMALLRADDGKVAMVRQGRPTDLGTFGPRFIELSEEELELHSARLSVNPQNPSFLPDFPRSSEILAQMWEARNPEKLDGVLSMDPVAMGYLMRGTGPVEVAGGRVLDSSNAAQVLMRDVYAELPENDAQDAFFDEVAGKFFDSLLGGPENPRGLLDGLVQAVQERRLMLWSRSSDEQDKLDGSAIAGDLPDEVSTNPEVGVFLNDASSDKLSYYLDYNVDVRPRSCGTAGNQVIDVRVKLTSTVPRDAQLPPYVVGPPSNPVPPGVMLNSVYLYTPVGGRVDEIVFEGESVPLNPFTFGGREVLKGTIELQPGESKTIDYVVITGQDQTGDPSLVTTPAATTTGEGFVGTSAC